MKSIFSRGASLQPRFLLTLMIAIVAIIADSRLLVKIRTDTVVSPFFLLAKNSRQMLDNVLQTLANRTQMKLENRALRHELLFKNSELLLLGQYQQENAWLNELLRFALAQEHKMITKVITASTDPYSNQLVIDKGIDNGIYISQPVINNKGVVGQVIYVSKFTSRVLLICDASHALPIQVLRNGIRVIITGHGCAEELKIEYLPYNIDIRVGDMLVTSGLDGYFLEGYPVAVVSSVKIDPQRAYTVIHARPTANLQRLNYLLLLWDIDHSSKVPYYPYKGHRIVVHNSLI
ncbi:rod shape-determining protein MreC [Candidatus Moranella endobia]|uniref:rod shape-determining protein MreC n=1 Tax=Candidatus Moranella endobia TaxID=1048758 RepID=UPI00059E7FA4|nr:rod shape-determining protein MreC [Candidatus Moranella endobia]